MLMKKVRSAVVKVVSAVKAMPTQLSKFLYLYPFKPLSLSAIGVFYIKFQLLQLIREIEIDL